MKTYWMRFGAGDPRTYTGLSPTFLIFANTAAGVTPPAISEIPSSGIYWFGWNPTTPITFLADAATTGPGSQGRYVSGVLDPVDAVDEAGVTITVAVSGIGSTTSSIGDSSNDPADLFGYVKRIMENLEGNNTFIKSSGALTILSRGSSITLASKTISNSASMVVKS